MVNVQELIVIAFQMHFQTIGSLLYISKGQPTELTPVFSRLKHIDVKKCLRGKRSNLLDHCCRWGKRGVVVAEEDGLSVMTD